MSTLAAEQARSGSGIRSGSPLGWAIGAIFLLTIALPMLTVFYGALQDRSPVYGNTQWSLDAIVTLFTSPLIAVAARNTVTLSVVVTIGAEMVGVLLAWAMTRTNIPGKKALNVLVIAPLFLSPLTAALSWLILAAPNVGLVNVLWYPLFGSRDFFNVFSFSGIAFVMVLNYVPYSFMTTAAMLGNMNASLEEFARSLGAGVTRTAIRITLRLVLPAIASSSLLIFMLSTEMFTIPGVLGRPIHFETLVNRIYYATRQEPAQWNAAAAIGLCLLVFVTIGLLLKRRIEGNSQRYVTVTGQGHRFQPIDLGRGRWLMFSVVMLVPLLSFILPLIALVFASFLQFTTSNPARMVFTLNNYRLLSEGIAFDAIVNSAILAFTVPTAVALFVVGVGYWCRQNRGSSLSDLFVFLISLPLSLPGIVLGVGLLWLYFRIPLPIYGTLLILALANFAKTLPYAGNAILPSLGQIDRSLDESARSLGAGPLRIMWRIHGRLILRSVVAAWLIGFILCARELNASIMLYTPSTRVMEVLIWDLTESGRSNLAYAVSVVQVAVLGLLAWVVQTFVAKRDLLGQANRR